MLKPLATILYLLWAIQAIASQPTHALIKQGQVLYENDSPLGSGQDVGPWRLVPFDFNPQATYTTKSGSVPSVASFDLPTLAIAVNGAVTPLVRDAAATKGVLYRGGNCELQAQFYPGAARLRIRYRVKYGDKIDYLALRLGGVSYSGYRVNLGRDGEWDGYAKTQFNGKRLFVLVADAREKYPRGIKGIAGSTGACDVVLHTNDLPNDYSREGIVDLRAYCTGTLTPALCPAYASFLTSDPEIKRAAEEISVADQVARQSDLFVSAEVWLSTSQPQPQSPLVLLDGFESPIWSKPKPGVENAGLGTAERRIFNLAQSKLADSPRGSILFGDIPEQPNSFYRVRFGAAHYFVPTLAWRSLLRTGNPDWYALARVFSNFVRDSTWLDGQQDHGKGLLPWSGPRSSLGHWVDSEALLFAWLCDGDALSLLEYERWLKFVTPPTETSREAVVPMRMFRVAAWYTGDAKWTQWADAIETRMHAAIKAGVQMTGPNWHPLAYKVPPNLSGQCPEGILSIRQLAAQQKLDDVSAYILYGGRPLDGQATGFGPLGEAHVGLQLDAPGGVYDYYRARPLQGKHRVIYGTSKDGRARVTIDKQDDQPSSLRIALGSRGGDIPGTLVEVYGPDGSHVTHFDYRTNEAVRFPRYPLTPDVQGVIDGFQVVQKSIPFEGPAGRYQIEVWGHSKVMLHGPLSKFPEWQDTCGEFSYEGQDASGAWPLGSVMVGK